MANAEKLLNEAHYAFNRINSGESRDNRRNASRARSLCTKIVRRYPASPEASSARSILRRLGDAAYGASLASRQGAGTETAVRVSPASPPQSAQAPEADGESLNWQGVLSLLLNGPKWPLVVAGFAAFFLFTAFGPLLLIFLVAIVLFIGPLKKQLTPERRRDLNEMIARANAHMKD